MSLSLLFGTVSDILSDGLILLVNGHGYKVFFKPKTQPVAVGDDLKIYCFEKITQEDREIFGFESLIEKQIFEILIKIPNVGPKIAYSIVSGLTLNELLLACSQGDPNIFSKVKGVGQKLAEKIAFELKNFLSKQLKEILTINNNIRGEGMVEEEAIFALIRLGLDKTSANNLVRLAFQSLKSDDNTVTTELVIQRALKLGSELKSDKHP